MRDGTNSSEWGHAKQQWHLGNLSSVLTGDSFHPLLLRSLETSRVVGAVGPLVRLSAGSVGDLGLGFLTSSVSTLRGEERGQIRGCKPDYHFNLTPETRFCINPVLNNLNPNPNYSLCGTPTISTSYAVGGCDLFMNSLPLIVGVSLTTTMVSSLVD